MRSTTLLIIAIVWFTMVLVFCKLDFSFLIRLGRRKAGKAVAYLLVYSVQLLIWGWLVPLALGIYGLAKKH